MSRPIEVWRDRGEVARWHWRCNVCGLLRGGWARTHPTALRLGLEHHAFHHAVAAAPADHYAGVLVA